MKMMLVSIVVNGIRQSAFIPQKDGNRVSEEELCVIFDIFPKYRGATYTIG